MHHDGENNFPVVAGLAIAAGLGVVLLFQEKEKASEHWTPGARLAAGAVGGGLLLYGWRSSGKLSRLAATAGGALLLGSLRDEPIRNLQDIVNPATMFS